MAFEVGDKVCLASDPAQEMTVVEVKGDTIVCTYKKGEMRKMKEYPASELKKL